MSGLRDAIAQAQRAAWVEATDEPWPHELLLLLPLADAVLGVVEAYLREHDAAVRQRIEAIDCAEYSNPCALMYSVLEALGGGDP